MRLNELVAGVSRAGSACQLRLACASCDELVMKERRTAKSG
jgi:hypothetical protein